MTLSDGLLPLELLSFGGINEPQWAAAVAYLRSKLPPKDRKAIAEEIEGIGMRGWVTKNHFPYGMQVRNILRRGGFDEAKLGVNDLDSAWGHLLYAAIADVGEEPNRVRRGQR